MNSIEQQVREFFDINKTLYFLFLCFTTFLILLMKKNFVEAETAAFEVLDSQGRIGIFLLLNTLQYVSIPLVYLWKFTVIGFLLWMGTFAFGYKIPFRKCWQVAMIAETIFFLPELIKIAHFAFGGEDPNLFDIKAFYPASLMLFVDYTEIDPRFHYPLKALNIFEVVYWLLLCYGVHLAAKKDWKVAVMSVMFSYVVFFFLWLWFYIQVYK